MKDKEYTGHKELASLMDIVLNSGIKIKSAVEVGKRAVEYTRGDEINNWILNNKELVRKTCPSYLKDNSLSSLDELTKFVDVLIHNGFVYRAQYQPLEGCLEKTETGIFKRPMWPKRLIRTKKQTFDTVGFYIISYEGSQRWNHFMLFAMIFGIFALCMFQAWPLHLKLAMWYLSVVLLSIMLTMIISRLILFVLLWFCGFDCWLFPNLFDEELGVVDSFKPLYSLIYRNDSLSMVGCRLLCSVLAAASIYELSKTHNIKDIGNFAKQSFIDVLDWGHQKLTACLSYCYYIRNYIVPEDTSIYKTIGMDLSTEFESEVSGETAEEYEDDDYKCLLQCGFKSLDDLVKKCMTNCECMNELLTNNCLSSCPSETIQTLKDARNDACKKQRKNK